jgi:hypothetical protein
MGGVSRPILLAVTAILGLCALGGFVMGLTSTMSRKAAASDEEAPIASNVPANATIKDAQPLAPPPPPPPKPKAAAADAADAASDHPPSDTPPKIPTPTESAPNAPLVIPPPTKAPAPAKLPDDLPPT